jgi:hypothetical protein
MPPTLPDTTSSPSSLRPWNVFLIPGSVFLRYVSMFYRGVVSARLHLFLLSRPWNLFVLDSKLPFLGYVLMFSREEVIVVVIVVIVVIIVVLVVLVVVVVIVVAVAIVVVVVVVVIVGRSAEAACLEFAKARLRHKLKQLRSRKCIIISLASRYVENTTDSARDTSRSELKKYRIPQKLSLFFALRILCEIQ